MSGGSNIFTVTISIDENNDITVDKTLPEIAAAAASNQVIVATCVTLAQGAHSRVYLAGYGADPGDEFVGFVDVTDGLTITGDVVHGWTMA